MLAGASYLDLHFVTGASRMTIYNIGGMVQYLGIVNGGGGNDASHVTGTESSNG